MTIQSVLATSRLYGPCGPELAECSSSASRALLALAEQATRAPKALLQRLLHLAQELTGGSCAALARVAPTDSAVLLRWEASTGVLERPPGSVACRHEGPSALALDKNAPQLFLKPHQHFEQLPDLQELLVVPLYVDSKPAATLWVGSESTARPFTGADSRLLQTLGDFALTAWFFGESRHELVRVNQDLEEAHRRKDAFFTTLCHELKSPLGAIANALELVKKGLEPEWAVEVMRAQTQQLEGVLEDVQDVARISQGKLRLRKRLTTVQETVESAILTVAHLVEERRHTLTVAVPEEPVSLMADPTRVTQVLVNLLVNAVRYTDPGGMIRISAEGEGDEVVFRVSDTGCGIAREQIPRIFDLYTQGSSGLRHGGGLGIGLALVRGVVLLHWGVVEVSSAGEGLGSEFVVRLPTGRSAAPLGPDRDPGRDRDNDSSRREPDFGVAGLVSALL